MLLFGLPTVAGTIIMQPRAFVTSVEEPPEEGEAFFDDDFASCDLSHTENDVTWGAVRNTGVTADAGSPTGCSLEFRFNDPEAGSDWAEQRFDMDTDGSGTLYQELWVELTMLYPDNYRHFDSVSSDNNKFFRLWSGEQDDTCGGYCAYYSKYGFSTGPEAGDTGDSTLYPEFGGMCLDTTTGCIADGPADIIDGGIYGLTGVGGFGSSGTENFMTSAQRGTEIVVVLQIKVDTSGNDPGDADYPGGNGTLRMWRNGVNMINTTQAQMTPQMPAEGTNGFNRGYILGAANAELAGGSEMVVIRVRRFRLATSNIFGVTIP